MGEIGPVPSGCGKNPGSPVTGLRHWGEGTGLRRWGGCSSHQGTGESTNFTAAHRRTLTPPNADRDYAKGHEFTRAKSAKENAGF
jgi:hypothetical protein